MFSDLEVSQTQVIQRISTNNSTQIWKKKKKNSNEQFELLLFDKHITIKSTYNYYHPDGKKTKIISFSQVIEEKDKNQ